MSLQRNPTTGFRLVKLVLPLLVLQALTSEAQTRPDAGSLLQGQQPATSPPRGGGGLPIAPPPPPPLKADSATKVTVKQFRISGNTVFTDQQLQTVLAEYLNKPQDMQGLNDALDAVKGYYRERGYFLALAYLPAQELRDGVVQVFVLEGRLGKAVAKTKPGARIGSGVGDMYMAQIAPGAVATESSIYRQLLLLQDLPGIEVHSTVKPSEHVGGADLEVDISDRGGRVSGDVDIDNYGSKFAGAARMTGQAFINNPLGRGDLFTVRGVLSQDNLTQVGTAAYVIPVGPWGTKVGASYTELRYRLKGVTIAEIIPPTGLARSTSDLGLLKARGEGTIASMLVLHPVIRSRDLNIFAQLSGETKNTEDSSLDTVTSTTAAISKKRVRTVKLAGFGDSRDGFFGGGLNAFGLTLTSGKSIALSQRALDDDDNTGGNDRLGSFTKTNVEYQRTQRINNSFYGIFRFNGQVANRNLATLEKMSAGGPGAVRAYPVGEGLADNGMFGSLEFRYGVPGLSLGGAGLELTAFVDAARVRRNVTQIITNVDENIRGTPIANWRSFAGGGVGVRLAGAARYSVSADVAWRIGSERAQSDINRSATVWVRGAISF